eukprot:TRINITY_DN57929_c0_g1_i1.p1 TRINITY_DN57929_c0_g1~~TRINITY_DN57929_c0_g1_i1.p1  ORF type:complete len:319 (+),score=32.41 TRINITY_DN57929_c0_g1_i1:73-1029(+)
MEDVYAWGSGSYGRLGVGHSRDVPAPVRLQGVLNGCDVKGAACGWYHSAITTSTGSVATFGSQVSRCLGTALEGDATSESEDESVDESGGGFGVDEDGEAAAVVAGDDAGRDAETSRTADEQHGTSKGPQGINGRKGHAEGYTPHVIRSFPLRVHIVQVAVGGDMLGAHTLAVSRAGRLYSWGYGPACGLGRTRNARTPTLVTTFLGFNVSDTGGAHREMEMEPLGFGKHSHTRYRQKMSNRSLGLQLLRPRIVKAACGGGFSAVLSSEGEVFTFGLSAGGRLGFRTKFRAQLRPRRLENLGEGVVHLVAGAGLARAC